MLDEKKVAGESTLTLNVLRDHHAIAKEAAAHIAQALKKKPDLVIGIATGATMEPLYAELVRMHREDELDFSQARFFNLDSYKGIPSTDRNSYDFQLHKLLLDRVNANPDNIRLVQGINFDPKEYEAQIKAAGGIDIQLLGLGGEGHIGFNEVGSTLDSRTREVQLSQRTLEDNTKYFSNPGDKMPDSAYTMGIGTILEAKELLVLANNPNKAWAVRNMMDASGKASEDLTSLELFQMHKLGSSNFEEQTHHFFEAQAADIRKTSNPVEELPARALHAHPNVTLLVDEEAASQTRLSTLLMHSNLSAAQVEALAEKFAPKELAIDIDGHSKTLFLPPGFDFYDPHTMELGEKFDMHNEKHIAALQKALQQTTDVGVGAHQDDVEIMAGPMLLKAAANPAKHWLTVIVTDGAASQSTLNGNTASLTSMELTDMRQREQREAAQATGTPVIQLKYPSAAVAGHMGPLKKRETALSLGTLFSAMPNMENVFGHNPIDKHETHLATFAVQTAALRAAHADNPNLKKVYGMEVWGGLTGIPESALSMFMVESEKDMARIGALVDVYQSQMLGQGRNYSKTTVDRMSGHGGYVSNPHLNNPPPGMVIGLDVTDFIHSESHDMGALAKELIERVATVKARIAAKHPVPETPSLSGGFADSLLKKIRHPGR